ncbi:MAG: methylmalonyl Co-A mutase-associated GTPase MeaB [Bacteroidetes bacterium HGW-Bacteroidetes-1]|jgi:LAO/AO transport system kinase|nr:MAG: methylmalonyl Co-A mutase-associated GTPase MeaB [Bacteroidetes bacterium HGW-Bacteroidetes-1]
MNQKKPFKSALSVNDGIEKPDSMNQTAIERLKSLKKNILPSGRYVEGILKGDIVMLSQAITLIESALPGHQQVAQEVIAACLPHSGKAVRLGITGVPGAGKSTFIEALGMFLVNQHKKIAVLAIDPSSQRSKGSILGDKTRMEQLANHPKAYIRPSAASGTLGGVARKTRESIILCEASGFDTIIVETVGVGQSETAVFSMVDFFLLLLISGAGDELQGIKRGIMEMADGIVVNKADGDNILKANRARSECENALHLFPPSESGVNPKVLTCSSLENVNIDGVWQMISDFIAVTKENGYYEKKRLDQAVQIMHESIEGQLKSHFYNNESVRNLLPVIEQAIQEQKMSSYIGAIQLFEAYFLNLKK